MGPRDGLQNEKTAVSVANRMASPLLKNCSTQGGRPEHPNIRRTGHFQRQLSYQ
jgi:hypothetical protein